MVELFTAGCFGRSPGVVNARSPASLRTSSPRRLGLNEVQDPDPPETDYASVEPKPFDRLTASSMTARASDPSGIRGHESVQVAPVPSPAGRAIG